MKVKYFVVALFAFVFTTQSSSAQATNSEVDVQVFESVLSTATWANFKYIDHLAMAKRGDIKATFELLRFSGTVDGTAALDHSVTLLELIASAGDQPFGEALNQAKPKLKSVLLDRLQLAQGRTKKEELRKPLAEWAPATWDVLNGKPFVRKLSAEAEQSCLRSHEPGGGAALKPELAPTKDAAGSKVDAPGATDSPKGRQ